MTPLADILRAIYRNDLAALATTGADVLKQADNDGRTPLMHAVLSSSADAAVVRILLDRGADASAREPGRQWTVLHFAVQNNQAALVPLLVSSGAEVNAVDREGHTPLWVLADGATDTPAALGTIEALLKAGADATSADHHGTTPHDRLVQRQRPSLLAVLDRYRSDQG